MPEPTNISRRSLATLLAAPVLAPPPPESGSTESVQAIETIRLATEAIAKVSIPREVEPSFRFEA